MNIIWVILGFNHASASWHDAFGHRPCLESWGWRWLPVRVARFNTGLTIQYGVVLVDTWLWLWTRENT